MTGEQSGRPEPRQITDAQTMRALAHPIRLELLALIRRDGDITATRAADALGESPGNMSWHLQTLAKYGFVEESGKGKGRARPWRLVADSNRFRADTDDPVASAAGEALVSQLLARAVEKQHEWLTQRATYPSEWRDSAFLIDSFAYVTAEEMAQMGEEIGEIFHRHSDRARGRDRPADARPVQLTAFGHPLRPTESGN